MIALKKSWLAFEQARNRKNADLYTAILRRAIAVLSQTEAEGVQVIMGHHLTFEMGTDLSTEDEVPAADSMLFDHDIMTAAFGSKEVAVNVMVHLAQLPCDERDHALARHWFTHTGQQFEQVEPEPMEQLA